MPPSEQADAVIRFQGFELNPQTGELRKEGIRLKIQDQPLKVLVALLQHPGQMVTREGLRQLIWPEESFGDFDHAINLAITKLRSTLGDSADVPHFIETLPRRGYRFIAPVESDHERVSKPSFEKEPKNGYSSAKESAVDLPRLQSGLRSAAQPTATTPRWSAKAIGLGLLILLAVMAVLLAFSVASVRQRLFSRSKIPRIESLAVLPLANLSHDPEQEYFADGMTDALISELGQIGSLRVISRTSVIQYKNAMKPVPQIARELNVDAVVEGSVLRAGDKIRISAQLIGAVPERHLWARNYERDLRDVLSLQGEIAHTIADEVQGHITPDVQTRLTRARPVNPKAHEAYLRGRFFLNKFTESDVQKALEYAQQAVDIDPDYGEAYGLLAMSYWSNSKNMGGPLRNKDAAEKVKAAASKAFAIDASLAEPHEALGHALFNHEWDWAGAEREFKRAIELSPNSSDAHSWYAWYLALMGRRDESIREATQAEGLDPFAPSAIYTLAAMYYLGRQYDQALEQGRKCVEMFPDTYACYGWGWLTPILEAKGMYEEEITAWQKDMTLAGENAEDVAALGRAYRAGGIKGAWRWDLRHWKEKVGRDDFAPSNIARRYAQLGEKEEALNWLEKGLEEHDDYMTLIRADPNFDSLRSEPRFEAILRRMNFPK